MMMMLMMMQVDWDEDPILTIIITVSTLEPGRTLGGGSHAMH